MRKIDLIPTIFITFMHIFPIFFWKFILFRKHLLFIFVFTLIKLVSVTTGFHRLWTHRSFETKNWIKVILAVLCNSTFENTIKTWTTNHRMHHRYENIDPELDPYSITHGFIWAHVACNFFKPKNKYQKIALQVEEELFKERSKFDNKLIEIEDKHYIKFVSLFGIIIPTLLCKLFYGDPLINCFSTIVITIVLTWHFTWSINSFAHIFGDKPYSTEHTSANNHLLSIFTCGEGYHNYHHSYPKDFKTSENLFCFNLTGWIIFILYKLKLATNLKQAKNISKRDLPNFDDIEYDNLE